MLMYPTARKCDINRGHDEVMNTISLIQKQADSLGLADEELPISRHSVHAVYSRCSGKL